VASITSPLASFSSRSRVRRSISAFVGRPRFLGTGLPLASDPETDGLEETAALIFFVNSARRRVSAGTKGNDY
jgi:hypothetical protein